MALPRGAMGLSAVCVCVIFPDHPPLTIFYEISLVNALIYNIRISPTTCEPVYEINN